MKLRALRGGNLCYPPLTGSYTDCPQHPLFAYPASLVGKLIFLMYISNHHLK